MTPKRSKTAEEPLLEAMKGAASALEEIIAHLPGETRGSLLILAEEHGVSRAEGQAALGLLELHGHVRRRTDDEGDEIWELTTGQLEGPSPIHTPNAGESGVLQLFSRNDRAEQRWRLVPDWVYCPLCGPVRVK